ncbi:DKNYY domain-containing protein [Microvirga sp. ACRRW]|uniref:DKNYY domain-containing protein n=1 Tax=Microvirga sp. ACRRW TaxID=2918205 RepID=UPI001EF57D07|nr:DKNYY domain-containing protein [Microvirga sp. ACRRW]MCG7393029.1 DKNYY domain-containing protein [Microvirga sp. ACRRW]
MQPILTIDGETSHYFRTPEGIVLRGMGDKLWPLTIRDLDAFEAIDKNVGRDKEAIYMYDEPVAGADPASFKWIGYSESDDPWLRPRYAVDNTAVWALRMNLRAKTWELVKVARLNPDTTRLLGGAYACDGKRIAFNGTLLQGADVASFEIVIASRCIARDNKRVYYTGVPIKGADPATWRPATVLGPEVPVSYSCDKRAAYFEEIELQDSDPATFVVLSDNQYVAADVTGLYWRNSRSSAKDRERFLTIAHHEAARNALRRHDPNPERWWNKPHAEEPDPRPDVAPEITWGHVIVEGQPCWRETGNDKTRTKDVPIKADAANFVVLSKIYARDKNTIFCRGTKLSKADPETFRVLEGYRDSTGAHTAGVWARDKMHIYRFNEVMKMDAASFEQLGICYARDKDRVYAYGTVVRGADPAKFEVIEGPFGRCGAKYYYEGYSVTAKEFEEDYAEWKMRDPA